MHIALLFVDLTFLADIFCAGFFSGVSLGLWNGLFTENVDASASGSSSSGPLTSPAQETDL